MGEPSQTEAVVVRRGRRSSYAKISLKAKLVLFQRVLEEGASTREMAKALGIKYSTAKTLIRNYSHTFEAEDPTLVRTACREFRAQVISGQRCTYVVLPAARDAQSPAPEGQEGSAGEGSGRMLRASKIEVISCIFSPREK